MSSEEIQCGLNNCSASGNTSIITMVAKKVDLSVIIKSSPFVVGDNGSLTCTFDFAFGNFAWSNVTFIWTKNGKKLDPSHSKASQQCQTSKCKSQLQITPVDHESKGNYTCEAVLEEFDFYGTGTTNASVKVWEKPDVVIEPNKTTLQKYDNISITCHITNANKSYLLSNDSLKWCFANGSEILGVNTSAKFVQSYSFQVESFVEIQCGLNNCSASGKTSAISMVSKTVELNVTIHEISFVEEETGNITCSFSLSEHVNLMSSNVTFHWSKNGKSLHDTPTLNISQWCDRKRCDSRILLSHIDILSEGKYHCDVKLNESGFQGNGSANIDLKMKEKPYLVMEPIEASVKKDERIQILCYVRNINEVDHASNTSLKWCFSNESKIIAEGGDHFNQSFSFKVKSTVVIQCGINSCKHGKSSNITVAERGETLCKKTGDWPSSIGGQEAKIPCPERYNGTQKRKCSRSGVWGIIDTNNCKLEKLEKVEKAINESKVISESIVQQSLTAIADVVNSTDDQENVAHINILQSVSLISAISNKNITFENKEAAEKITGDFAGVVSQLLNVDKTKVEKASVKQKKDVKSKIISSVDSFANSVTKSLHTNESVTVQKKNLLLTIEKVPKQEIVFPKDTPDTNGTSTVTKFKLPEEALSDLGETVAFTAVKYDDFGSEFDFEDIKKKNITVDSSVLSLTIENLTTINSNITLTFQRKNKYKKDFSSDCVFLNLTSNTGSSWSTKGCSVNFTNTSLTVCTCDHLTNFAILMSLSDDVYEVSRADYERLKMISIIGCSFSITGAFITIIIYLYFWRYIKSRRSSLVVNLCIALCIAYLMFLTAVEHTENKIGCIVIAALLHYFFLAMFCIMLCLGIDLAVAILNVFSSRSSSAVFYIVGWGLPAVIVGITLGGAQLEGYGDDRYCWLRKSSLYGFIVPVLCIISINLIIVIIVMRIMYTSAFMVKKSLKEKTKSGLRGMCALLPILGLTWVFGILSINEDLIFFQYLFALFNSLQGLFIFLFHVVLNNQVRQAVSKKIKQYESKTSFTRSKSSKSKIVSHSSSGDMLNSDSEEPRVSNRYTIPRLTLSAPNNNTQL